MSTQYGITSTGFVAPSQQDIISQLESQFRTVFGNNINLAPSSNFGQIIGILSGDFALLWQLGQTLYSSRYPSGAEGTSVDNILALNNLKRKQASATRTNLNPVTQANGITLYGLVALGTPGTIVPQNSIIQDQSSPPVQFTIDADITIQAAVNAIQTFIQSNTPDSGNYSLSIVGQSGFQMTTGLIPWNALPAISQLSFSSVPVAGNFTLSLSAAGSTLTTANIPYNANAAQVQSAIQALSGYSGATVSGSFASGFQITWGSVTNPLVTIGGNTLGVTITSVDSIQADINNLYDSSISKYPYTDLTVTSAAAGYNFNFGVGTPYTSQPSSGSQPQALITVPTNTLMNGTSVTNVAVINSAQGAPAQGVGSATCAQTGPNFVGAGTLTSIVTPISGWTGVTNQLDCVTGTNVENDTEALERRQANLDANANGPLAAIISKVSVISGVTAVVGFQNVNEAALQVVTFNVPPGSGSFKLVVNGNMTSSLPYNVTNGQMQTAIRALGGSYSNVVVSGSVTAGFTVDFNGSFGGQPQGLIAVSNNTTGSTISVAFGRPGKSFEIVVAGGDDQTVADTILASGPAGIQPYGSTVIQSVDQYGNIYNIGFSRPTQVPIYVSISMVTDLYNIPGDSNSGLNPKAKFNPLSIGDIQKDIVSIGNEVGIGGLIIGFGSNGLIGAFNSIPGIVSYTLYFDRMPNPTTNVNLQMQPEEEPIFEAFNVAVSYV
jgi:uncharacterized phage protein gp47/JayE